MSFSVKLELEIGGDRDLFTRAAEAHRNPRVLMDQVGVLGMSSAVERLTTVLRQDTEAVRSGLLMGSLGGREGIKQSGGNEHTIFDVGDDFVVVGSNLPYAAQVQFGGRIEPREARALAIPLKAKLQRQGISPLELDPQRELLSFVPVRGGASGNVFGLLVDDENDFGFGADEPLFALASFVDQEPRPFLYWSDEDAAVINEELYPKFLGL